MTGIPLSRTQERLEMWLDAEKKIASGQSYSINGRQLARADLAEVQKTIEKLERKVQRLSRGGIRVMHGVPQG